MATKKRITELATIDVRKARAKRVADILELDGHLDLSDAIRNDPRIVVTITDPELFPDQGTPEQIAASNPDIRLETIKRLFVMRADMKRIVVSDNGSALIKGDIAKEIENVTSEQ